MKHFWLIVQEDPEPDGGCFAVAIVPLLLAASVATYWGGFNFNYFSPGAILFFIVLVTCCVLGSRSAYRDDNAASFFEIAKKGVSFYIAGAVLYAAVLLVELVIKELGGFFEVIVIVFGATLIMAGACLPLLVIQSAVIYAMKR